MKCVKCEGKLVQVRVDDVDVDQCDTCGGIWFDAHELERLLRGKKLDPLLGRGHARPGDDERRGRCPRCKSEGYLVRMASRREQIHVDTCAICGGKWLDGGELDALHREGLAGRVRRIVEFILDLDLP
jgi:Zn-finger nucleic acid-binding protein